MHFEQPWQQIDTSLCAPQLLDILLLYLQQYLRGSSPIGTPSETFGSSLSTAHLRPGLAYHQLSFAPVWLIIDKRPLLTLAYMFSPASSPQLGASSPRLTTPQLTSLWFTSPQPLHLTLAQPSLGSPHLDSITARFCRDCHEGSLHRTCIWFLSPAARLSS